MFKKLCLYSGLLSMGLFGGCSNPVTSDPGDVVTLTIKAEVPQKLVAFTYIDTVYKCQILVYHVDTLVGVQKPNETVEYPNLKVGMMLNIRYSTVTMNDFGTEGKFHVISPVEKYLSVDSLNTEVDIQIYKEVINYNVGPRKE